MAIKNKIQANEYDAGSPTSISADKIKPLANAAIKKLTEVGFGIKTSFFLEADYFKDANGKPDGPFLAIGDSPGLEKEFKSKKTSPNIAYGNLYIEQVGDEEIICFELVAGQGKLKKPADWKALLKVFTKMMNTKCKLVSSETEADENASESASNENETEEESITEHLERKAAIAEELIGEVKEIAKVYDRDKKEKLLRKTTKWMTEFNALNPSEKNNELTKHAAIIQKGHQYVQNILETDNQITSYMEQIHAGLQNYVNFKNNKEPQAISLSTKLIAALDKVKPLIEKVKDNDLLQECESIQTLLKIANQ